MQWSWIPYTDEATLLIRQVTDDDITGCWPTPSTPNGEMSASSCVDVSYKTLVDSPQQYSNRVLYTEMEMFIPVEYTVDAVNDFIDYQNEVQHLYHGLGGQLYTQVRYVHADDITLSPMNGRNISVISMVVIGDQSHTANTHTFALYAKGLERITREKYDGVPHWGKKNWANESTLTPFYTTSHFDTFNRVREAMDPEGRLLNSYLTQRGIH